MTDKRKKQRSPLWTAPAVPAAGSLLLGGYVFAVVDAVAAEPRAVHTGWIFGVVGLFILAAVVAPALTALMPPSKVRVAAVVLLSVSVLIRVSIGIDVYSRPPTAALPSDSVVRVSGRCAEDLRPSSDRVRRLVLALDTVTTRDGWQASATGNITALWTGEAFVTTPTTRRSVVPMRGDGVTIAMSLPEQGGSLRWVSSDDVAVTVRGDRAGRWRRVVREGIRRRLARLPSDVFAVVHALLLGTRESMPEATVAAVRRAGAAHVIALSGMHLGVLALILARVVPRSTPRPVRAVVLSSALFGYVWVSGWIPSLTRALVLLGLMGLARLRDRSVPMLLQLARCVVVLAALWPSVVVLPGFQLSVWALVGLMGLSARLADLLTQVLPRPAALYLGTTLAAMVGTTPYALVSFGSLYPVGLVTAGVLSAIVGVIMWAALLFLIVATVPLVGTVVMHATVGLVHMFLWIVHRAGAVAALTVDQPQGLALIVAWCTLVAAVLSVAGFIRRRRRNRLISTWESYGKPQFDF